MNKLAMNNFDSVTKELIDTKEEKELFFDNIATALAELAVRDGKAHDQAFMTRTGMDLVAFEEGKVWEHICNHLPEEVWSELHLLMYKKAKQMKELDKYLTIDKMIERLQLVRDTSKGNQPLAIRHGVGIARLLDFSLSSTPSDGLALEFLEE